MEGIQARDDLRRQEGDEDDLDYHSLHWRFFPTTIPIGIGQDKVEGDILDEVPKEKSDVDLALGDNQFFKKMNNFFE